ncbi:uncharacterized protein LOC9631081 [Selaginella moellendorffii]|uniref:uncharacterized protein LOC9631081 n=1 Tax=Selaginella moellendorffii TaxID=88036 RepID=UPI000D1CAF2A|nr:uncharacterized protein LOC9631081 [Selaginella moellendorffii]|eukprot:XP_024528568.1 uncharacterized protein LOC9631081 [Selaginella moellendorffii]
MGKAAGSFGDDLGDDFLTSWKPGKLGAAPGLDLDDSPPRPMAKTGKTFDLSKFDMDLDLDGGFNKLASFNIDLDLPGIDATMEKNADTGSKTKESMEVSPLCRPPAREKLRVDLSDKNLDTGSKSMDISPVSRPPARDTDLSDNNAETGSKTKESMEISPVSRPPARDKLRVDLSDLDSMNEKNADTGSKTKESMEISPVSRSPARDKLRISGLDSDKNPDTGSKTKDSMAVVSPASRPPARHKLRVDISGLDSRNDKNADTGSKTKESMENGPVVSPVSRLPARGKLRADLSGLGSRYDKNADTRSKTKESSPVSRTPARDKLRVDLSGLDSRNDKNADTGSKTKDSSPVSRTAARDRLCIDLSGLDSRNDNNTDAGSTSKDVPADKLDSFDVDHSDAAKEKSNGSKGKDVVRSVDEYSSSPPPARENNPAIDAINVQEMEWRPEPAPPLAIDAQEMEWRPEPAPPLLEKPENEVVDKVDCYTEVLEEMWKMLKQKKEEATDLLVRAIVANNKLLLLNSPVHDEKISLHFSVSKSLLPFHTTFLFTSSFSGAL